jgi:RES domain-containing protein
MLSAVADMPVVKIDDEFHNLIPSRFPTVRVYERIAGGRDDEFAAIEELTNPRLREKERLTRGLAPVDQEHPRFQNWNHAPFAYPNPEGSRFYGAERNVLELAGDLQTALAISVARRETFLSRTKEPATALEMRQIVRPVRGSFLDARGWDGVLDRERRLSLGREVAAAGHDGILFNPAERPSATAIVALRPECLGRPIQSEHFKFIWNGQCISALYAFGSGENYSPSDLGLPHSVLAA